VVTMLRRELCTAVPLLAAIVCTGCTARTNASNQEVPVVSTSRAVRMDMQNSVTLTAELAPFYEVDVMAKEAGYIRHMLVDIGDHVKAGQLICVLEIPELQADMERAKANVETASSERLAAEQNRKRAVAAASIAHLSYTRILDVSKKEPGLVPLQEVDVAHSRDIESEAQVASAEQGVQGAMSSLQAARSALDHENALFAYTRIISPLNGLITQRYASDGAMIQAGTSSSTQAMPVVHVAKDDVLRLMLPVPEANVGVIHNGAPVSVTLPALHRSFIGKVTRFSGSVQASTRTMTAEVDLKNLHHDLIPGMYAQVQLTLADYPNTIAVPVGAVDGGKVYVVDASGIVRIRNFTAGIQSPQFVQALSGVEPGDALILGSHSGLEDGEKVQAHFD
jgi:RND family efflux transporter MFP subunit